jgi:GAF domain-containing protein
MTATSQALAAATASLVADHDIAGTLTALVNGCVTALDASCGSVMVADHAGRFELLTSSGHGAAEIILHESQHQRGPSVTAWRTGTATSTADDDPRWPELGGHMTSAGLSGALATPLRWNGVPHGALTVFCGHRTDFTPDERSVVQAFADMAMLVIVHTDRVTIKTAAERVEDALASRVRIEQAKGVLAQSDGLTMGEAFERLRRIATEQDVTLTEAAVTVIRAAARR